MERLHGLWNDTVGHIAKVRNSIESLIKAVPAKSSAVFFLFVVLSAAGFLTARILNQSAVTDNLVELDTSSTYQKHHHHKIPRKRVEIPLNCTLPLNQTKLTCPANYPTTFQSEEGDHHNVLCPEYLRWIRKDLEKWKETGITLDLLLSGQPKADFRLIILNGKAYLETYRKSFQTRDVFTVWGILQLLRKYPGRVPDLDLMFNCDDMPVLQSKDYYPVSNVTAPPVMHYCSDEHSLDIVFPDWSFWGWSEINIKPWESLSNDLIEGNNKLVWLEREPHAYWKGNPDVARTRQDLMRCNVTAEHDWGARLYRQNWRTEIEGGFKQSNLASQCIHRYKIYIEGRSWSVSEKYILACNSLTLLVKTQYYNFFSRNLMPLKHYWPIKGNDKCRSIKFAVDWGESHKKEAQAIGKAASEYVLKDMKMDYVYDYMFHLLNEYAKLLKFKPTVPPGAVELCSETMACAASGREKEFMVDSMVKGPSITNPCTMPAPYDLKGIESLRTKKEKVIRKVEKWEKKYWNRKSHKRHKV